MIINIAGKPHKPPPQPKVLLEVHSVEQSNPIPVTSAKHAAFTDLVDDPTVAGEPRHQFSPKFRIKIPYNHRYRPTIHEKPNDSIAPRLCPDRTSCTHTRKCRVVLTTPTATLAFVKTKHAASYEANSGRRHMGQAVWKCSFMRSKQPSQTWWPQGNWARAWAVSQQTLHSSDSEASSLGVMKVVVRLKVA